MYVNIPYMDPMGYSWWFQPIWNQIACLVQVWKSNNYLKPPAQQQVLDLYNTSLQLFGSGTSSACGRKDKKVKHMQATGITTKIAPNYH